MNTNKTTLLSIVVSGLLFSTTMATANTELVNVPTQDLQNLNKNAQKYAQNEVIISFKEGKSVTSSFSKLLTRFLGKEKFVSKSYNSIGAMHIKSDKYSTERLMNILKQSPFANYIDTVTPNNIRTLVSTNDSSYDKLWAIENRGQEINNKKGTADADMDVAEAWEKTKGSKEVIVAVLDTGVDYNHDDLKENMWNGSEYHGYDFAGDNDGNNDDNPMPDKPYDEKGHYHGTHVAGTIGAVSNNNVGIAGVAQDVSIMALKVFRPNGYGYTNDILEALDYVAQKVDEGENIVAINASYGGGGGSQDDATNKAIKKLGEKGVVFCAAAGNDGENIDNNPSYPASYDADNIISIAATDQDDKLASFSNYGKESVDVAAPGTNILSTYPENKYAYLQGTSMATPNVVGSIALLSAYHPDASVAEKKSMIMDNVDVKSALNSKMVSNGRVNVDKALGEKEEPVKNKAPKANDDSETTSYQTTVEVAVLSNDSDADGDELTIKSFKQATNGKVEKDNDKLLYTPKDGFSGEDSFEYTITDGEEDATATVTVKVKEEEKVNSAPEAKNDTATTEYETEVAVDVLDNDSDADGDALEIKSFTIPANGSVQKDNGKLLYTPKSGFSGEDSFEYTISDGEEDATATVTVTVKEEEKKNSAPEAKNDTAKTEYETEVTIDVLKNDSDADDDALEIKSFTTPSNGSVKKEGAKLVYTPKDGFSGEDSFEYIITDGKDDATAKVTVEVEEKEEEEKRGGFFGGFRGWSFW